MAASWWSCAFPTHAEDRIVTLSARKPLEDMASLQRLMEGVKASLGKEGRVLVRWSGTEPKLRVMVEGPDEGRIGTIAQELVAAAREDVG